MKRFFVFMLAVSLVLACAGAAVAAIDPPGSPGIDTWYSIEDEAPFFSVSLVGWPEDSDYILRGRYYLNDFAFANGYYESVPGGRFYEIEGSHLFAFGLFAGVYCYNGSYPEFTLGYCWNWDSRGYLAGSLDYNQAAGIDRCEINLKYRTEAMLIRGDFYIFRDAPPYIRSSLNYQVAEDLVIGGEAVNSPGSQYFEVGATWKPGSWVFDLEIEEPADYCISGMYYFGGFGIGLEYDEYGIAALKAKYGADDTDFILRYEPGEVDYFRLSYVKSY